MLAPLRLGLVIVAHLYFASLVASFGFTNDEYDVRPGEPFNLKFECDIAYDAEISLVRLDLDTGAIEHDSTLLQVESGEREQEREVVLSLVRTSGYYAFQISDSRGVLTSYSDSFYLNGTRSNNGEPTLTLTGGPTGSEETPFSTPETSSTPSTTRTQTITVPPAETTFNTAGPSFESEGSDSIGNRAAAGTTIVLIILVILGGIGICLYKGLNSRLKKRREAGKEGSPRSERRATEIEGVPVSELADQRETAGEQRFKPSDSTTVGAAGMNERRDQTVFELP